MFESIGTGDGKKVEYIELIYDLIFVYLIGRSNSLLELTSGFFTAGMFLRYLFFSLVILQIWYFSALFINRYGSNGVSDHVFLFINMYLLYFLADGISLHDLGHYIRFNAAWGLILVNIAAQYALRLLKCPTPWEKRHLLFHMLRLLVEAAIVLISIPLYSATHLAFSWVCLPFGFAAGFFTERVDAVMPVNFEHLSERVMLFVVFTFGEMIVAIAEYFDGSMSPSTLYFSLMTFLIVAGLFVSYGFLYNRVIDRERPFSGTVYMLIHIVMITALNCLTLAMLYMQDPAVSQGPKNVFLAAAFLGYYLAMFFLSRYAKENYRVGRGFFLALVGVSCVFALLEYVFYQNDWLGIAASVLYVYAVFAMIVLRWRRAKTELRGADRAGFPSKP